MTRHDEKVHVTMFCRCADSQVIIYAYSMFREYQIVFFFYQYHVALKLKSALNFMIFQSLDYIFLLQ